jgi:hypothetical protein
MEIEYGFHFFSSAAACQILVSKHGLNMKYLVDN